MQFAAIIEKDENGYFAYVPQLKGCISQGDTMEEAMANIREAIELYLEVLDKDEIAVIDKRNYVIAPVEVKIVNA